MTAAAEAARKIRQHMAGQTPMPCNPTFMDNEDQWWQLRHWPTLGLHKSATGPHGKHSKVQPAQSWSHDLMPDAYPTLEDLLSAMEKSA